MLRSCSRRSFAGRSPRFIGCWSTSAWVEADTESRGVFLTNASGTVSRDPDQRPTKIRSHAGGAEVFPIPVTDADQDDRNERFDRFERLWHNIGMQTTLRLNDQIYRDAKAEAARLGVTLTQFIEAALQDRISRVRSGEVVLADEVIERNQIMERLLLSTAHFRVGERPGSEEMNER